jgi:hypothetical protein
LHKLRSIKHQGWQLIITLDQLGFAVAIYYERIWLRPDQEPHERPRRTIQDKAIVVTIAWKLLGLHMLDALPTFSAFDAEYQRDHILTALVSLHLDRGVKELDIDADDARAHRAQKCIAFCGENGLGLAAHQPHTPYLARSYFVLFGHVKHCLQGMAFA